jgi:hypothetical protein
MEGARLLSVKITDHDGRYMYMTLPSYHRDTEVATDTDGTVYTKPFLLSGL